MQPINQEVLFYLAFAAALYEGCVDQERSTVLTQAECCIIARSLYSYAVPPEQQDQEKGAHFEELFGYLYGRTVTLLREHSFPELTELASLLARKAEQEGKAI